MYCFAIPFCGVLCSGLKLICELKNNCTANNCFTLLTICNGIYINNEFSYFYQSELFSLLNLLMVHIEL